MAGPVGLPVIDTMIGFPHEGSAQYDFIRKQTKDRESKEDFEFPVEYMFKDVPKGLPTDDPVSLLLQQMDRFGIEKAMIGVGEDSAQLALKMFPDRFIASGAVTDPNDVMGSVNAIRREYEQFGIRATSVFPSGTFPQVPIDDPKMYPIYATCVELGIPIFVLRRGPGSADPVQAAGGFTNRHRDVRLPRSGVRHPPRLRAVGGSRGQADAEVAQPVLLDIGLRAQVLPEGHHRLRELARCGQGPLRRVLPDGFVTGTDIQRAAQRAAEGRGVAEVPLRQRRTHPRPGEADAPMALAITTEQEQLAEAVSQFAARHAPIDKTRAAFDSIAAGELPPWWEEFTAHGFHAVHLPEDAGGQGGTLADMACVVEAAAAALLPGPLLSTATTSAVASLADASAAALMADLAAGATAAIVLPEHSDVHAVRRR